MGDITLAKMHDTPKFDPLNPPKTKVCKRCKKKKKRKEFRPFHQNADGKDTLCITCRQEEYQEYMGRRQAAKKVDTSKYFDF